MTLIETIRDVLRCQHEYAKSANWAPDILAGIQEAQAAIAAADRARGFAGTANFNWRRPTEWVPVFQDCEPRRILALHPDGEVETFNMWPSEGAPHAVIAWAEMPAPPAWATQSPERWSGDAPRDADDDRLSPNESFMAMRALRDRRPQHDFTPAEWRAWEVEKGVLLERVWRSANAHETPGVAALAGGDDDYAFERDDYGGLAAAIRACCNRNDYVALRAVLSNNLNVILSALTDRADPVRKESLPTEPPFPRWSAELAHALRELLLDRETNKGELFSVRCAWEELRKAAFPETSDAG